MVEKTIENYDFYCVDFSRRITDEVSSAVKGGEGSYNEIGNFVTKAISVLHENGLYAFFLYIVWRVNNGTRGERRLASAVSDYLIGEKDSQALLRLKEIGLPVSEGEHPLEVGEVLCRTLEDMFFAKDLIERTLLYVRYNIKTVDV